MALYGLAVCGGKSSRMGFDKSQLHYFGLPQADHVLSMLSPLCRAVFLSCNSKQANLFNSPDNKLIDLPDYEHIGPMAALLTAFKHYPDADFLTIGCDYPFLTTAVLQDFLSTVQRDSTAAAFYNADGIYEPLLALYTSKAAPLLFRSFDKGHFSLQHFLGEVNAEKYIPGWDKVMVSVDTPEAYSQAKATLNDIIPK